MRVLHVINDLELGGSQRVVVSLANEQARRGVEVAVCAGDGALSASLVQSVDTFPLKVQGSSLRNLVSMLKHALGAQQWDVVHTHQRRISVVVNCLSFSRDYHHVEHVHNTFPPGIDRWLSFRADALIACGSTIADMLVHQYKRPAGRVHTVLNGVEDHGVRRSPRGSGQPVRIVNIARASEQKDPLRFVRLVRAMLDLGLQLEATWYGDGDLLGAAKELAVELSVANAITFPGARRDAVHALASADALLLTSRWEGLPLVGLEASAAGVPVFAPDVGSLRDLVINGENGLLFPANSSDASAADALAGVFSQPSELEALGARAASRYNQMFTLDSFVDGVSRVYAQRPMQAR